MSVGRICTCAAFCLLTLAGFGAATTDKTTTAKAVAPKAAETKATSAKPSKYEQMLKMMLPQEKLDQAAVMFAPVALKYMPVAEQFRGEFAQSKDKRAVIVKYMPQAESALAEAKAMEVPPELANDKADFIRTVDALIKVMKFAAKSGK